MRNYTLNQFSSNFDTLGNSNTFLVSSEKKKSNLVYLQFYIDATSFRETNINFLEKCKVCNLFGQSFKQKLA